MDGWHGQVGRRWNVWYMNVHVPICRQIQYIIMFMSAYMLRMLLMSAYAYLFAHGCMLASAIMIAVCVVLAHVLMIDLRM